MNKNLNNSILKKSPYRWYQISKRIIFFFNKIRSIWHRITKGYCNEDVWDLKDFYLKILVNSLRDLAETSNSYPTDLENPDEWKNYLKEMALHFENSIEDFCGQDIENSLTYSTLKHELFNNENEELNKALESWRDFEQKQMAWRKSEFKKAMQMLEERFDDLWD